MAWLNTDQIRAKFNIQEQSQTKAIPPASETAKLTMRGSVNDETFAEAEGTNQDSVRQQSVIQSHAYLTYYFLLKDAAHLFTREGLLKQFQANTSAATQQVQMNQILTPAEIERKKAWALENAKFFIDGYGEIFLEETAKTKEIFTTLKYF